MPTLPVAQPPKNDSKIVPQLKLCSAGCVYNLESFSHYVGRQIGLQENGKGSRIGQLAEDYLKRTEGIEVKMLEFLTTINGDESLCIKLKEEFDRCIYGYFAFHWSHASSMVSQVLSGAESAPIRKFKCIAMDATRKQRVEKVTKAIKNKENKTSHLNDVTVPIARNQRSPILLFLGGGMGAGKSTVINEILKEPLWSDAVVVEADAFKESDPIYKALKAKGVYDMYHASELVHKKSVDAAESLLVKSLNEGRDVILDGTLSWKPFFEQTIAMVRNVHQQRYRKGVGHLASDGKTLSESYWEEVENGKQQTQRKPYRIELIGVVCDPYLAVVRGIRRAIITGRAVRVKSQLASHKRFAKAFPDYCQLVDYAKLYSSNDMRVPPKKGGANNSSVGSEEFSCLKRVSMVNEDADSIDEIYQHKDMPYRDISAWKDYVLSTTRETIQRELKEAIQKQIV